MAAELAPDEDRGVDGPRPDDGRADPVAGRLDAQRLGHAHHRVLAGAAARAFCFEAPIAVRVGERVDRDGFTFADLLAGEAQNSTCTQQPVTQ